MSTQSKSIAAEQHYLNLSNYDCDEEAPWRSEEVLYELFHNRRLSTYEIADRLECSQSVVSKWMNIHEMDARGGRGHPLDPCDISYYQGVKGYIQVSDSNNIFREHQLAAIADGADPYKVFGYNGYAVHHKNTVRFDNRPENLTLVSHKEHGRIHSKGEWTEVDGEQRLEIPIS